MSVFLSKSRDLLYAQDVCSDNLNICILYMSCDNFSDLWKPYFKLLRRFWPDCPYKIYLLSNHKDEKIKYFNKLLIGDDVSWSDNLIKALSRINEKYVLLLLDDFLIIDQIDSIKIQNIISWILSSNSTCVRITDNRPKPDKYYNELVGIVSKGSIYRTSLRFPIWDRKMLLSLLRPGENAWDFEISGSLRSDIYDGFYATWEGYISTVNCVIKGKWNRNAVKKIKSLGVDIDLSKRSMMTKAEMMYEYFKIFRLYILYMLPAKHRRSAKEFFLTCQSRIHDKGIIKS